MLVQSVCYWLMKNGGKRFDRFCLKRFCSMPFALCHFSFNHSKLLRNAQTKVFVRAFSGLDGLFFTGPKRSLPPIVGSFCVYRFVFCFAFWAEFAQNAVAA
jgi:hypothetical protein